MTPSNKTACFLPTPVPAREAEIYHRFLEMHCERRDEPGHACKGAVTVRRKNLTLSCPLCGDARKTIPDPTPATEDSP